MNSRPGVFRRARHVGGDAVAGRDVRRRGHRASRWTSARAATSTRCASGRSRPARSRAHVLDVREEFADDYILPALQAGAVYEGRYPLATALGRPLIAKQARRDRPHRGRDAIAHGCTGKGNDQVRIDVSARALEPGDDASSRRPASGA